MRILKVRIYAQPLFGCGLLHHGLVCVALVLLGAHTMHVT